MKVELSKAVLQFFPNPSFEMIFFEAIANSIDAGSDRIKIDINIEEFTKPETLIIKIEDNGCGFNDHNFTKFSKLLKTEDKNHKGLGRLVYLHYFEEIEFESHFENQIRRFVFDDDFDEDSNLEESEVSQRKTTLTFRKYRKHTVKTYEYLKPKSLKDSVFLHFFPLLHSMKLNQKNLTISLSLTTEKGNKDHDFFNSSETISLDSLPDLLEKDFFISELDLYENFTLYYQIEQTFLDSSFITAVCAEGRTIPIQLVSDGNVPKGYKIIFLLYSDYFNGKVNPSRQKLEIEPREYRILEKFLREKISEILCETIPTIAEKNKATKTSLEESFPHLCGYFDVASVGLLEKEKTLEIAQRKFFEEQKEILECSHLTDEQYFKSLKVASRLLTEYVLYRTKIIQKLNELNASSSESDIHNLIVPMQKTYRSKNLVDEVYLHNAWILDDKFMTYSSILSDEEMTKLFNEINENQEGPRIEKRPDIAIVFSNPPTKSAKFDVVIVELKKKNVPLAKKEEVISQLKQRARKLLEFYGTKVQRFWFYGIVEFDNEFKRALKEDEYIEIFSKGDIFYKEHKIIPDFDKTQTLKIPMGMTLLSYDALFEDAKARNNTFLTILKESIKKSSPSDPIKKSESASI